MKWSSGRDGSIEIETDDELISIAFENLEALDKFVDDLVNARNDAAEAVEQGNTEGKGTV